MRDKSRGGNVGGCRFYGSKNVAVCLVSLNFVLLPKNLRSLWGRWGISAFHPTEKNSLTPKSELDVFRVDHVDFLLAWDEPASSFLHLPDLKRHFSNPKQTAVWCSTVKAPEDTPSATHAARIPAKIQKFKAVKNGKVFGEGVGPLAAGVGR